MDLLTGFDLDQLFRWPSGRAERMAKKGQLPFYTLPDGSVRFARDEIDGLVQRGAGQPSTAPVEDHLLSPVNHDHGGPGLDAVQKQGGGNMRFDVVLGSGEVRTVEAENRRSAQKLASELYGEEVDHVEDAEDEEIDDDLDEEDFDEEDDEE